MGSADELWARVRALEGRMLVTTAGKAFRIVAVGTDYVRIAPESSGKERPVHRSEIEGAVAMARAGREVSPVRLREAGVSEFNPAYVAAIVRALGRVSGLLHRSGRTDFPGTHGFLIPETML